MPILRQAGAGGPLKRETAMNSKLIAAAAGLILIAGAASATTAARTFKGQKYAASAKISLVAARSIALQARAGTITDQELEKESGGSGLRYSFDVRAGSVTYEVGIDARTGKVLENRTEGPNAD